MTTPRDPFARASQMQREHRAAARRDAREKRHLVLGAEGFGPHVRSHRWDKLPADLNVTDYDVVILDYTPFEDTEFAAAFPQERLPARQAMTRLLFSPGTDIIAIGNPATLVGAPPPDNEPAARDERDRVSGWLPYWLEIVEDHGSAFDVEIDEWARYLELLDGWRWFVGPSRTPTFGDASKFLRPMAHGADDIVMILVPAAQTRFGSAIAFGLQFIALQREGDPSTGDDIALARSNATVWMPAPDRATTTEAIALILRERYGITDDVATVPDWVDSYTLPAEAPLVKQLGALDRERAAIEVRIADAQARVDAATRPRVLLYEKGIGVLEPVVRDVLRELGAEVTEPDRAGVEDALIAVGDRVAAVEIKGTKNAISLNHVRQVVQWATDAKLGDGRAYKALIVGNPHCELPLEQRGETLAPNAATMARNGDVAVLTTAQLFEALRQQQSGSLDVDAFWNAVFAGSGALDLPTPKRAVAARQSPA